MGMLGNKPAAGFQSIEKQSITGNGGTTYALDHAVTSVNDLEVFVNNVRQEPTTAYTISGQNIVMSEAIANTDSFYLIYQSRSFTKAVPADTSVTAAMLNADVQTSNDARYVNTTGDTMTGDLGVNVSPSAPLDVRRNSADGKIAEFHQNAGYGFDISSSQSVATMGSGYLQDWKFTSDAGSGAVEQMRISKEGYVTTPNQPAFDVSQPSQVSGSHTFQQINLNRGSHYNNSNGRFTAPVAGVYAFQWTGIKNGNSTTTVRLYLRKNGSRLYSNRHLRLDGGAVNTYGDNGGLQWVVELAVNDYITAETGAGQIYNATAEYTTFNGYLLG